MDAPGTVVRERSGEGAQPIGRDTAIGIGEGQYLGIFADVADGRAEIQNFLAGARLIGVREDDADAGGEHARGNVRRTVGGDNELEIRIILGGQRGEVVAKAGVIAFYGDDDGRRGKGNERFVGEFRGDVGGTLLFAAQG